jgi:hypothetical protein
VGNIVDLKNRSSIRFIALALSFIFIGPASAHDVISTKVTWSREIVRIVDKRCASCHREGSVAFSLLTYQDARPWAKAIKEETLERRMPPWSAVKGFADLRDDQGLTQEEIELISDWVEGGAPEGDPALLPKPVAAKAEEKAAQAAAPQLAVTHDFVLASPVQLTGIRAQNTPEGASFQAYAERPDGSVEPLLWLLNYRAQFDRVYYYVRPLSLPAGTVIRISPAGTGDVALVLVPPVPSQTRAQGSGARAAAR